MEGEISELARNFNRITSRLQKTIDSLETSRGQIQTLLSQVCLTFGQNIDMAHMLEVFLKSLLSLTGLEMGAIFLLSLIPERTWMQFARGGPVHRHPAGKGDRRMGCRPRAARDHLGIDAVV